MSTVSYTSREELKAILESHFGDDLTYWEVDSRKMFYFDPSKKTFTYTNSNPGSNLVGLLPTRGTVHTRYESAHIESTSTVGGKQYSRTDYISQLSGPDYTLLTFNGWQHAQAEANLDAVKSNSVLMAKVREVSGIAEPTDYQICTTLSSLNYTCVEDVPSILPETVQLVMEKISGTKQGIRTRLLINGSPAPIQVLRHWIYPVGSVPGVPANQINSMGEYASSEAELFVDTDFRNREDYIIPTKDVRVDCQAQYRVDSGELKSVVISKQLFSFDLPTFDYFGG